MRRGEEGDDGPRDSWAVRDATAADWPAIWPILEAVIAAETTFVYAPDMPSEAARDLWMGAAPARTAVALDAPGRIVGTARMGPNYPGPGAHVASASFMVAPPFRGRGVGRRLGLEVLAWAVTEGYQAMQFNAVVASNTAAVRLWTSLGFRVIGVSPKAFRHPMLGLVDLHIMHHDLSPARLPDLRGAR